MMLMLGYFAPCDSKTHNSIHLGCHPEDGGKKKSDPGGTRE
jgi:hypothetical protein